MKLEPEAVVQVQGALRRRFFRYKAAIVGGWLALSAMSLVVACPGASLRAADLGARLVVNTEQTPVIVLVHNESDEAWREVTVIVNQHWRASVEEVKAHGALALTPKLLMGANGTLAPADLRVTGVELRTREGRAQLDVEGR